MTREWQVSYIAVSALLGEPLDDLHPGADDRSGASAADLQSLLRDLRAASRATRALAIARVVADVVVALDDLRLA